MGRRGGRRKQLLMPLRKREDAGNREIAQCEELALEESMYGPVVRKTT